MGLQRSDLGLCWRLGVAAWATVPGCGGPPSAAPQPGRGSTSTGSHASTATSLATSGSTTTQGPGHDTGQLGESSGGLDIPPRAELEPGELRPGGDTTVDEAGIGAFVQEAANLGLERRAAFQAGLQFFRLDWEVAPATPELDGLGPTFNAASCLECHTRNGRGLTPLDDESSVAVLLRLSSLDGTPDPRLGGQLQPRSIAGVPSEGQVSWSVHRERSVAIDGGFIEPQSLSPNITPGVLGALDSATLVSPRVSMQLVGMGLLEAVPEAALEAWADPDDADADGVTGRVSRIGGVVGRFGWKASQPTVRAQVAAAFAGDLGITTELHPTENCPRSQSSCASAPTGGSPELPAVRLDVTAAYVRLLGVPARRGGDREDVLRGKTVFHEVGCAQCHRPSFVTGPALEPELEGQTIWPYTDLLLHDLGPDLSQGGAEGDASPAEWRTAPLWSVGLLHTVHGGRRLLHDGRARSLAEAVVWHGGEAEASRAAYLLLPESARLDLHAFIDSL
ncbi:MAG: di-heme oxidoredictase family protein [Nannocystales bacterium]